MASTEQNAHELAYDERQTFRNNSYAEALAYASAIYTLLKTHINENKSNDMLAFLQKELILNSDTTTILEDKLREARKSNIIGARIIDSIMNALFSEKKKSTEMEMQLIYTLCSLCRNDVALKEEIAKKITDIIGELKRRISAESGIHKNELLLQYRSISIALCCFLNMPEALSAYNIMLLESEKISSDNLAFHLCYYSRLVFSLQEVLALDFQNVSGEMLTNTFSVLIKRLTSSETEKNLTNPFHYHNLITLLQMYKKVTESGICYAHLQTSIFTIAKSYKMSFEKHEQVLKNHVAYYDGIISLLQSVLDMMKD